MAASALASKTVNEKGAIGVAKVVADVLQKGFFAFLPFDGSSPVDLVLADKSMSLRRIQVKYREPNRYSAVEVSLQSIVNGVRRDIDVSKIDGWAIYSAFDDRVYYVLTSAIRMPRKNFAISLLEKSSYASRMARDYLRPDVFWEN